MDALTKKTAPKDVMNENIRTAVVGASRMLESWEGVAAASYVVVSSQLSKLELVKDDPIARSASDASAVEVARIAKINPYTMKGTLEKIAITALEVCAKLSSDPKNSIQASDELRRFSKAILHAREAGPISPKSLASIRDVAEKHSGFVSVLHSVMNSDIDHSAKLSTMSVLLDAKLNPEYVVRKQDPTIMALAIKAVDPKMVSLLSDHGASPYVDVQSVIPNRVEKGISGKNDVIRAWDALAYIEGQQAPSAKVRSMATMN